MRAKHKIIRKIYENKIMTHCYDNGEIIQYLYDNNNKSWYILPSLKPCKKSLSFSLTLERTVMMSTEVKDTNNSFNSILNKIPIEKINAYIRKIKIDKLKK